jgi:hypothetical protein
MSGKLSVHIREKNHPKEINNSRSKWFAVSVQEVGKHDPLCWNGIYYDWIWLPLMDQSNKINKDLELPAGKYFIKGYENCQNNLTHLAFVQVTDGETVSVNLEPSRYKK